MIFFGWVCIAECSGTLVNAIGGNFSIILYSNNIYFLLMENIK